VAKRADAKSKVRTVTADVLHIGDIISVHYKIQDVSMTRHGTIKRRDHQGHGTEWTSPSGVILLRREHDGTVWAPDVDDPYYASPVEQIKRVYCPHVGEDMLF
jgi:hypothetical protein